MFSPDFHKPHATETEPCPGCDRGWPQRCECGGEIHAETLYFRDSSARLIQSCSACGPKYMPWLAPPSEPDPD